MHKLKILFIALYSDKYPSIGESHGISVIAGSVMEKCGDLPIDFFEVIDMVASNYNNLEDVIKKIKLHEPNVIGISLNYGTYNILKEIFKKITSYLTRINPLFLLGGPIATYVPEFILKEIYNKAYIVIGEGDETVPLIIRSWYNNTTYESIPNLCYLINDRVYFSQRKLVPINRLSLPYRGHIDLVIESRAQIFIESSRGCSWCGCTFCLRGLTDSKGKKSEYRRFDFTRLSTDILKLVSYGANTFTFADEDFLGNDVEDNNDFVNNFESFCISNELQLTFDASFTVHSIFSSKYSEEEIQKRKSQLKKLKKIGLRKIFLGIESGSDSQLKRFGKGHSSSEALMAINIVKELEIEFELGFIMFDPLCSLIEIEENLDFLSRHNLIKYVSSLSSELRLQIKTQYVKEMIIQEIKHNIVLFDRKIDLDTISFSYKYLHKDVSIFVNNVKHWNKRIREIHYPLKNLSRYGKGGILGKYRNQIVKINIKLRNNYFQLLKKGIQEINSGNVEFIGGEEMDNIMYECSICIIDLSKKLPRRILDNRIFKNVLDICQSEIENLKSKFYFS